MSQFAFLRPWPQEGTAEVPADREPVITRVFDV